MFMLSKRLEDERVPLAEGRGRFDAADGGVVVGAA